MHCVKESNDFCKHSETLLITHILYQIENWLFRVYSIIRKKLVASKKDVEAKDPVLYLVVAT